MNKLFGFIKKEVLEMLPPTIFFFAVFCLMVFTRSLIFQESQVGMLTYAAALIGALIIGKSILIADALPVWHYLDQQPRVVLIVGRTIAYALVALLFQFLEEVVPLVSSEGSFRAGMAKVATEVHWPLFWGTHIQLLVFLVLYNIIAVIAEEMGRKRFTDLLFGKSAGVKRI